MTARMIYVMATAWAISLVIMLGMSWSRSAEELPAPAPDLVCLPTVMLRDHLDKGYSDFRMVPEETAAEAIAIFKELTSAELPGDFNAAALVDADDGEGILLVGYRDRMCDFAVIDAKHWYQLTHELEGFRA